MEGALGPVGIIGPSGHPVCTSYLILSAKLYVTSRCFRQWWNDPLSSFSPSGTPGWQRKSWGDGAWRCFDESFFCLYCEHRMGYLVWRQHTTQPPLPLALFISYCAPLFVVTLTVTLSCCGIPVRVINVGCMLISSFFKRVVECSYTGIIHNSPLKPQH